MLGRKEGRLSSVSCDHTEALYNYVTDYLFLFAKQILTPVSDRISSRLSLF